MERQVEFDPRLIWCFSCYQDLFRNVDGVEFVEGMHDLNILDGGK